MQQKVLPKIFMLKYYKENTVQQMLKLSNFMLFYTYAFWFAESINK